MTARHWMLCAAVAAVATAAPAADVYKIDSDHTYPSLEMPHIGLSIWRGKFNRTTGTLTLDLAAHKGRLAVSVDTASIDFGHDEMNEHATKKAEWLDVAKYPAMTYEGDLVFKGETAVAIDGKLTLKGITKPLKLTLNSFKCMEHPYFKKPVCGGDAEGDLDRADFGMAQYTQNGMGKIHLRIQAEAMKE